VVPVAVGVAVVCGVVVAIAVGVAVAGGVVASVAVALGTAGVVAEVVGARLDVELCPPGVRVGAVPDGVLSGWSDTQATTRERINIGAVRRMNLTPFSSVPGRGVAAGRSETRTATASSSGRWSYNRRQER